MHGLFIAYGPSFRRGLTVGRLDSLDVYPLMAELLDLEPAANDGDPRVWRPLQELPD